MPLQQTNIIGRRLQFLIEFSIGGRVYRYADTPATVTKEDGSAVLFSTGLELEDVSFVSGEEISPKSVKIKIASSQDWAYLDNEGYQFEYAEATIYRWAPGITLERSDILCRGQITGASWGDQNEPLEFTVQETPYDDAITIPSGDMAIDETTWPVNITPFLFSVDEGVYGAFYPIVFGYPGYLDIDTPITLKTPATPALLVEYGGGAHTNYNSRLLIAGHEVEATTVTVYDTSDNTFSTGVSVLHTTDLQGRKVATVRPMLPFTAGGVRIIKGNEYWVSWGLEQGGMFNRERTGPMRGAGEVLRYLLEQTNLRLDIGRMEAMRTYLDAYKIDAYINSPTPVLSWISAHLLPVLPIRMLQSSEGWYFQYMNWRANLQDCTRRLSVDRRDLARISKVTSTPWRDTYNDFRINFAKRADTNVFLDYRVLTAERTLNTSGVPTDVKEYSSYLCYLSQKRFAAMANGTRPNNGKRQFIFDAHAISDRLTAEVIGQDWAFSKCLPRKLCTFEGGSLLDDVFPGEVIAITDGEIYWRNKICYVLQTTLNPSANTQITVMTLDTPQRER